MTGTFTPKWVAPLAPKYPHAVFLKLRRRRWRHKITGATISRDLSFIAEGSRFTKEVAAFLKDIHRDEA
jgi:hypothetical protein